MSNRNVWMFADVDNSLITVSRTEPEPGSVAVAHNREGQPVGWLTPRQRLFLDMVKDRCHMVFTTARTTGGLSRLKLGVQGHAICTFGGIILHPDGEMDPHWRALLEADVRKHAPILEQLEALVKHVALTDRFDVRIELASDAGMPLYLSVKHNAQDRAELKELSFLVKGVVLPGWNVHLNGNFLAVLPPYLDKVHALKWFRKNLMDQNALTIGFGDSKTDVEFMRECDLALMPTNSQNFGALLKEVLR